MNRQRKVGPFTNVTGVDVTGLTCNVNIYYVAEPKTVVVIEGSLLKVGRVSVETTSRGGTTQLTIADTARAARVRVSKTGNATAGPGGYANTGLDDHTSGGRARVSRTGDATAGPGGSANSGVRRRPSGDASTGADLGGHVQTYVVQRDKPFRRSATNSPVTVSFFVAAGTTVAY